MSYSPRDSGGLTPIARKLQGALFAYAVPRLALDAELPSINLRDVTRYSFDARKIGDRVRHALRGRLSRDADLDDLDAMLEAIEAEGEDGEEVMNLAEPGEDRRRARARDHEIEPEVTEQPWPEAKDDGAAELCALLKEKLRGRIPSSLLEEVEQAAQELGEDRRRRASDRRRLGRDNPPPFAGRPNPGGTMTRDEGIGPGHPEFDLYMGTDHRAGRVRRFGQDSKPRGSFAERFPNAGRVGVDHDAVSSRGVEVA
jgi:hypothetical protein